MVCVQLCSLISVDGNVGALAGRRQRLQHAAGAATVLRKLHLRSPCSSPTTGRSRFAPRRSGVEQQAVVFVERDRRRFTNRACEAAQLLRRGGVARAVEFRYGAAKPRAHKPLRESVCV